MTARFRVVGYLPAAILGVLALLGCAQHKVFVDGGLGNDDAFLKSAELFDPSSNNFVSSASVMSTGRDGHTATLLTTGTVLIAGGQNPSALNTAEIYNPSSDSFAPTGTMNHIRVIHTATLLDPAVVSGPLGGDVLIAGGDQYSIAGTAELYNPVAGSFTETGNMTTPRMQHDAVLITFCGCPADGKVLLTGGLDNKYNVLSSAELYNPATQTFVAANNMKSPRYRHTATLLQNGKVLIAGGAFALNSINNVNPSLKSAEIYDPATGTFTATGSMGTARQAHAATLLSDGKVLITGGQDDHFLIVDSAELYDPVLGTFSPVASSCAGNPPPAGCMTVSRDFHISVRLDDGRVLIAGGTNSQGTAIASAEIYDPSSKTFAAVGNMSTGRVSPAAALVISSLTPP